MYMETLRPLTATEIDLVAAGDSASHAAFIGAATAIGGAIGARAGDISGSEFGALLGAAVCSPGGPEASAACAAIGGWAGLSIGDVSGRDAGAGAAGALAEEIWENIFGSDDSAGNQNMSYDQSESQPFLDDLNYNVGNDSWSDTAFDSSAGYDLDVAADSSGDWSDPYSNFDADTGGDYLEYDSGGGGGGYS